MHKRIKILVVVAAALSAAAPALNAAVARPLRTPETGFPALVVEVPDSWSSNSNSERLLITAPNVTVTMHISVDPNEGTALDDYIAQWVQETGDSEQRIGSAQIDGAPGGYYRSSGTSGNGDVWEEHITAARIDASHIVIISTSNNHFAPHDFLDTAAAITQSAHIERGDAQAPARAQQQANITPELDQGLRHLISTYLDNYQRNLAQGMGSAVGFTDEIISLEPGHDYRWQVNLRGGGVYRIIGACDNECSNVDIELIDSNGVVVASDTAPDDEPVVTFTPASNSHYIIRVILQTCTVGPCYVGVRMLQPGGGGVLRK